MKSSSLAHIFRRSFKPNLNGRSMKKRGWSERKNQFAMSSAFQGNIIHSLSLHNVEIIENGGIGVDKDGKILFVSKTVEQFEEDKKQHNIENVTTLKPHQFVIPGFVDTHCHAPQYVFTGTGTGLPLLQWLEKYTFNHEKSYKDTNKAKAVYEKVVLALLKNGTTTVSYFSSIHLEAAKILREFCLKYGQRALVGKVNMDRNSPDDYIETTEQSYTDTVEFVHLCGKDEIVQPTITPRFVPTCTPELMQKLGDLAKKEDVHIQSHVSENKDEIEWVKSLHPDVDHYVGVYHKYGLLTNKTILAHGIHLSDAELALMSSQGASIAHCPLSNYTLLSGLMCVKRALDANVKVGLGTDVSGGYSPSMLDSIRHCLTTSAALKSTHEGYGDALTWKEAFYLATLGGSEALNYEDIIGNFIPGKSFDALVIDVQSNNSPIDTFGHETVEELMEKYLYLGDDRNVVEVYVQGVQVMPL